MDTYNLLNNTAGSFMKVDISIKRFEGNQGSSQPATHRFPSRVEFKPVKQKVSLPNSSGRKMRKEK